MTVDIHLAGKYAMHSSTSEEQLSSNEQMLEGANMDMYLLPSGAVSPVTRASPSTLWWRRRAAVSPKPQVAEAEPAGNTGDRSYWPTGTAIWSVAQLMGSSRCDTHLV